MAFAKTGEQIVATNGFLTMVEKAFLSGGAQYRRTIIAHPGAVVIVPIVDGTRVVVVRQFRPSVEEYLIELPAGKRDVPDEGILVTAERELQEECGLQAQHLSTIGSFLNSPGFTDEMTHVVLAVGLSEAPQAPQSVEEEDMEVRAVPIGPAGDFSALLGFTDGKSIIGIALAKLYLMSHQEELSAYADSPGVRGRFR
ncbi:NUDIX hydrolase [Ferrimicrobium sp.]|uniref:NUDIX hydrolase n=1 Tax=Ferrimicrobium sp. TaxID=2926050 RepID=UPI0026257723|nr:NUDIX hydrolase [Ferrimicrobium sp.]